MTHQSIYESYTTSYTSGQPLRVLSTLQSDIKSFKYFFTDSLPSEKEARILEVGCGYGKNIVAIKSLGYTDVTGVDISAEQVNIAHHHLNLHDCVYLSNVHVFFANKPGRYDLIILIDILEHLSLDDLLLTLSQCYASLNHGGRILIQVPNGLAPLNPFVWGDLTHLRAFTLSSLRQLLSFTGNFKSLRVINLDIPVNSVHSLVRLIISRFLITPFLNIFMKVSYGRASGGVYTPNIAIIAAKA